MTEEKRLGCLIQALMDAWAQHKGNAHEDGCGWCIFERAFHERMMKMEAEGSVLAYQSRRTVAQGTIIKEGDDQQ